MIVLRLETSIAAVDGLDAIEDFAVEGGSQQLKVLGVGPDKGTGCARGTAQIEVLLGHVCLVPDLLGKHIAGGCVGFVGLDEGADVFARRELIVGAFAGEQRPHAALAPAAIRTTVGTLTVAIPVVAKPSGTLREIALKNGIDDLEGIDHQRVIGAPDTITDQLQEASVDDFAGFELVAGAG